MSKVGMKEKGRPTFQPSLYDAVYPTPAECRKILVNNPEILKAAKAFKVPKPSRKAAKPKMPLPKFSLPRPKKVAKDPKAKDGLPTLQSIRAKGSKAKSGVASKTTTKSMEKSTMYYGVRDLADNSYYLGWSPLYSDLIDRKKAEKPAIKVEPFLRAYSIQPFESEYSEPPVSASTKRKREKKKIEQEKNDLILKELYEAVFDEGSDSAPGDKIIDVEGIEG